MKCKASISYEPAESDLQSPPNVPVLIEPSYRCSQWYLSDSVTYSCLSLLNEKFVNSVHVIQLHLHWRHKYCVLAWWSVGIVLSLAWHLCLVMSQHDVTWRIVRVLVGAKHNMGSVIKEQLNILVSSIFFDTIMIEICHGSIGLQLAC